MSVDAHALVRPDIDLADGQFYAGDSHTAYAWMRAHEPVFRDRNGLVGIAGYRALIEAERRPELFSSAGGIRPDYVPPVPMMIDMDDPGHLRRRKLVNAGFSRKRVQNLAASIENLCDTLIDAVCERGECDFVWDIAAPLPMAVIGDLLGVRPQDRAMFLKWSDDLVTSLSSKMSEVDLEVTLNAYLAFTQFTQGLIEARRAEPTEDLISVMTHAVIDGEQLTDEEIIQDALLILVGGDETTRHTLTGGTAQLLRTPEQFAALRTDTERLMGTAVEEMLRWTSPVKNMCRQLTSDTDFYGTSLREGEKVMLLFESANFDEDEFVDPLRFDIERNPNSHLAFGFGTHFCMGNQLARLEISIMMRKILQRLPDLRLATDESLPLRAANFVSGLEKMPVTFTPTAPVGN
ncbi:cytochrome P450 [Mycobacterium sp. TNTM28]|uniref:Cytochrome P450 n=1 Tax=[Mycobacterium] fortunisiensis TaxID=2600579 RepID=A0ABS6KIM4_9MYCO|nr:cytochrome P450 [[Mycobacterium] fortunisiensis]MBU9763452.1 cytochrome P450 [[Mycobacterium] fortunisiensis]